MIIANREGAHFQISEILRLKGELLLKDSKQRGEVVTAIYHSHVGAGAYFSELDQEFAEHELFPFPGVAQVVMAVWDAKVAQVGLFERDSTADGFLGRRVEASAP